MQNAGTSRLVRALQTSAVALGVVVACTVVDKDDYTFRDGDGDAGGESPGGTAGKGGTGTSGTSGKGGASGKGGSSGNAGSAGAPGEGGGAGVPGGAPGEGGIGGQPAGECGDGTQDPGEDCDDGNRVDEECGYFATECSGCSRSCRRIRAPSCGDGAVNGAHATSITLEFVGIGGCTTTTTTVPLALNGVPIPGVPWGAAACTCAQTVQTFETTDAAVLAAVRQSGNYLSFVTPYVSTEFLAWVNMVILFDNGQRIAKVAFDHGAPGDAETRNPGDPTCPVVADFFATQAEGGRAFDGFPVEQCDGGADCYSCASLTCLTLASSEVVSIPDATLTPESITIPGQMSTYLPVPELGPVRDVNVKLDITHTFDRDLTLSLTTPAASITLVSGRGDGGDNFTSTQFDQACTTPIASGVAPFTGCFQPEGNLNVLNGLHLGGRWGLTAVDNATTDIGTINGWTITICGAP